MCMHTHMCMCLYTHTCTVGDFIYLGWAWASSTLAWLHCTCMCIYPCLFEPTTYCKFQMSAFKYFIKIDIVWSMWRLVKGYCQIAASVVTWSEDNWSWSTHCSLCMFFTSCPKYGPWEANFTADYWQTVCTVAEIASPGKGHVQIIIPMIANDTKLIRCDILCPVIRVQSSEISFQGNFTDNIYL